MEDRLEKLIQGLKRTGGATQSALNELKGYLNFTPPDEYLRLMALSNGVEGAIGRESYLVIWPVEEVVPLNEGYAVTEFVPGIILFGSDGGNTGYGFDSRSGKISIIEMPLIGMDLNEVEFISHDFLEFLEKLAAD